jgi:type I restriction enzyme S subunit
MSKEEKCSFADDEHTQSRSLGEQGASSLKGEWKEYKLRQVCTLINGRAYSKSELLDEGKYPVLRVGNFFTNNHWYYSDMELAPDKYCDDGDLLYAWSASFGPRIWAGGKVIFHYHIWKVLPNAQLIDKKFLFFWFLWDADHIRADQGTGTTMMHVAKGSMEDRDILLPSLSEQERIGATLDEAFEAIDLARANAERNSQTSSEVFEAYRDSLFLSNDSSPSNLLNEFAVFRNGVNFTKGSRGKTLSIVGVRDFQDKFIIPTENLELVTIDGEVNEDDLLHPNDLLTVRSNGNVELIGRTMVADSCPVDTLHSGFTIRTRLLRGDVSAKYLCHFMRSRRTRRQMIEGGTGINIKSLNQGTLGSLSVPLPAFESQVVIAARLDEFSLETQRLKQTYKHKLRTLEGLKQSLLHQAFSGNL